MARRDDRVSLRQMLAARRVSDDFREQHPEVPWTQIIGQRNRLIHGYDTADLDRLWLVMTADVPNWQRPSRASLSHRADSGRHHRPAHHQRALGRARAPLALRPGDINRGVFDSAWEASEAFALGRHQDVTAWVKNDHLGFEIV